MDEAVSVTSSPCLMSLALSTVALLKLVNKITIKTSPSLLEREKGGRNRQFIRQE